VLQELYRIGGGCYLSEARTAPLRAGSQLSCRHLRTGFWVFMCLSSTQLKRRISENVSAQPTRPCRAVQVLAIFPLLQHLRLLVLGRRSHLRPAIKCSSCPASGRGNGERTKPTAAVRSTSLLVAINIGVWIASGGRAFFNPTTVSSPSLDMASSRHLGAITELNLSACQPNTLVDRINAVPGLKTSTGKFPSQPPFVSNTPLHETPQWWGSILPLHRLSLSARSFC
jgi:hypothetical protein